MSSVPRSCDILPQVKEEDTSISSTNTTPPSRNDSNILTIESLNGNFNGSELNNSNAVVQNLVGATLYLDGSPASLKISRLTNCKLICGPVRTTVLVEECRNCVFFICCHQFRANSSEALDIYLRVETRAIISDCTNIRFAPYKWSHDRSSELLLLAQFDVTAERFDLIDDFDWLAFSTASPNWDIIPEDERAQFPEAELPEQEITTNEESELPQEDTVQFVEDEIPPKKKLQKVNSIPLY